MSKFLKTGKYYIPAVLIIFFLALFLRIYNLTIIPIFGDEAIYIRWAQVMRAESTLRFIPLTDGKQPLFMWSIIPFLKIIPDPLTASRLVSALTGLGNLLGVVVLSYVLFKSKKISLTAGLIYAISPFSVFFDRLALADSMLAFFVVWAFVFSVITVKKIRLDSAMLAGIFLGGALLTKSPASFFAVLTPLTLFLHKWPPRLKETFNRLCVFVFLFGFTYVISYGMYNILRLGPNFHMIGIRNKDYIYPLSHVFSSPLDPLTPFLDRILEYIWILGPSILVLLIVLGIYYGLKEKSKAVLVLIAWGIIPILIVAEYSKTMTARYIYFSIPFLFILASLVLLQKSRSYQKYFKLGLAVFVLHALFIDAQLLLNPQAANLPRSERSGYLEEWTSGYGIKEISELIRKEYGQNPQQKIVVGTEGLFGTLPDGLQVYLNDIPEITVIGVGLPVKDVPIPLAESKKFGNKTYLVVNSTRFSGSTEDPGLELVAVYGKALRPDGFKESLLFFEVKDEVIKLSE